MGTRHRQGSCFSAACSIHAASPRRGSSFSVRSTCCPVAWRLRVLFHSAPAFLPHAPEWHFLANGRVRRRRLFIYSARWPGVKERKCLFSCPLFPPSFSISVGPRHKVFQPLATFQPKNKPGEEKGTSLALSAPPLPSNPPPFF